MTVLYESDTHCLIRIDDHEIQFGSDPTGASTEYCHTHGSFGCIHYLTLIQKLIFDELKNYKKVLDSPA